MGTVHQLPGRPAASVPIGHAVDAFLLAGDFAPGTESGYRRTLTAFVAAVGGPTTDLAALGAGETAEQAADEIAAWFLDRWGSASPATYNRALYALRSAVRYWQRQPGWLAADPTRRLTGRSRPPDRTRDLSPAELERFLTRDDLLLRDKTLYRLLYESAARTAEVLALDIDELDLRNRRAKVSRKGGAADIITWRTPTARLLPRLIGDRRHGPVFLTERRARVELPAADLDPDTGRARLSYRQAWGLFKQQSGGWTLHQLRHTALTEAAAQGTNTGTLLAFSGHASVTSLSRYTRVSADALARWQANRDPATRKGR